MLNPSLVRQNPKLIAEQLARRHHEFPLARVLELEASRKVLQQEVEALRARRNELASLIGQAKKRGESADRLMVEAQTLPARLTTAEAALQTVALEWDGILYATPNVLHESVPAGKAEEDNVEMLTHGTPALRDGAAFVPLDHVALGEHLGLDFEAGVKLAGSRFTVMTGPVARMHRALTQFMLDVHTTEHGYTEVYVPYLVNAASMRGTGQLPKFEEDLFKVARADADPLYLIPTAEVPVTNLVRDTILDLTQLPAKWVCHTPCFRSEAGAAGRDTKGLIRQHQFDKVELVQVVEPTRSYEALDELTQHAQAVLRKLELPYRVMTLCAGDTGFSAAKTLDIEVWLPGQGKYREISSCSNFEDFQARRLQARYRASPGAKPRLVHTVNGSGLAVGRTLVAILENYQQADGSVVVPEVLRPYMGGLTVLS